MKRRDFMIRAGSTGTASMLAAARVSAQQPALPVIGFLSGVSPTPFAHLVAAFHEGLRETGFIEGRNVSVEYRWAEGRFERLPALAEELVRRGVSVLVASGGDRAALSAKAATSSLPIVFTSGLDPVAIGLVASLSRPGGNLTGLTLNSAFLEGKRLSLLKEAMPSAAVMAFLSFPGSPSVRAMVQDAEEGARHAGVRLLVLEAQAESEFEAAFAKLAQGHADGLVVGTGSLFNSRRDRLVALAAQHKVPAIYELREFVAAGGLMSYGTNLADVYRQIGIYTGRILKGAKPADLPVIQPTRFELVMNLKTAKALGLTIPPSLLLRADEVIE